jgi:hypothetical protein
MTKPVPLRRRPHLVAVRMNDRERALVDAVSEAEGEAVSDLLRAILIPVLTRRRGGSRQPIHGGD